MDIIQFKNANCKSCYKCVRNCDLKAIKFNREQAHILSDSCVYCGKCTLVCPQSAKQILRELANVKKYIASGVKVYASVAPSYIYAFPGVSFASFSMSLKKLGFVRVEETAVGATKVTEEYINLITENKMDNIITTCCPSGVSLVEKYYPELISNLAPVMSPASAHAKMLKELFGNRMKVVFIGPCVSKKYEAEHNRWIDNVLLFDELRDWMEEKNISFGEPDPEALDLKKTKMRLYPISGGILRNIPDLGKKDTYRHLAVDGMKKCINVLESLKTDHLRGYFIEMSVCEGSCAEGPAIQHFKNPFLTATDQLFKSAYAPPAGVCSITEDVKTSFATNYTDRKVSDKIPDEDTINDILAQIGKTNEADMLNCSTCGYATCRDKAIAVYQGKADLKMCLPYLRDKAESLSNVILENTPNAIFLLDEDLFIIEYNTMAKLLFKLPSDTVGSHIYTYLSVDSFEPVLRTGEPVYDLMCETTSPTLTIRQTTVRIPSGGFLAIIRDVTKEEENQTAINKMRDETIDTAQKVIDKQMRVAQQIASLLGETTGETKAALTNLRRLMEKGESL